MKHQNSYCQTLLLALLMLMSACGFQLRGSGPSSISAESVYVDASAQNDLGIELKTVMSQMGVQVTSDPTAAQYVLKVSNEKLSRRVLTVSPATGKVTEYEIIFDTSMSVLDNSGNVLRDNEAVRIRTDLSVDEDSALGKFDEERLVGQELRQRAASQILRLFQAAIQ